MMLSAFKTLWQRPHDSRLASAQRGLCTILLAVCLLANEGCSNLVKFAVDKTQPQGSKIYGAVFYLGGAGPVGNIGSFDIPKGLRRAGYKGHFEVFPWQTISHATDQIFIARNRAKAEELAEKIRRYRRLYPDAPIHLVALSAGTGVATFALEYLPESIDIESVIFLGCSMSSKYDMTPALRRIRGRLFVLHSANDEVLKNVVWYTGTVDRASSDAGIAGLEGFYTPSNVFPDTERQYLKLINVPYRSEFSSADYGGGHTSATSTQFVQQYLAPAIMGNPTPLMGRAQYQAPPATYTPTDTPERQSETPIPPPWPVLPNQQSDNGTPTDDADSNEPDDVPDVDDPLRPPPETASEPLPPPPDTVPPANTDEGSATSGPISAPPFPEDAVDNHDDPNPPVGAPESNE